MTDTQRRGKSGKELLKSARWIFLWLLGYPARGHKSFRSRRTGEGMYYWRNDLEKKLKNARIFPAKKGELP